MLLLIADICGHTGYMRSHRMSLAHVEVSPPDCSKRLSMPPECSGMFPELSGLARYQGLLAM